ncbi:L,D-transpeptidase family protein [Sphingomonas sp. M1-B02]|uniref:L,D-transpeptidase family protein n=1 Tax=Sphingomonas sp. M1-B02 TaxID=3114300 RepID=UPI0022404759|nr:L,D-transpeptidase family protein [Sphingomonas sp. S6-11]UZK66601.1 L,D-transpeptidase family protein [Sphingomonas sp. S6-11]
MRFPTCRSLLALVALCATSPAAAQTIASTVTEPIALKAGQFVWFEQPELIEASTSGGAVTIVISLGAQLARIFRGERLVGVSTVSTGSRGRETPTGEFTILQKKVFHRSNLYSNAPMPYMQRLTWDGIALHAGHLPGYPASHGCIRFPKAFARTLYDLTEMGGSVSVVDAFSDDLGPIAPPAPLLMAEVRNLGGGAYDVLTMRGDPPEDLLRARPSSWVLGPAEEIVQPLPGRRGSR